MRRDLQHVLASGWVRSAGLAGLFIAGLTLVGCASSGRNDGGRHDAIQGDLSPELDTLTMRPIDFDNRMYYTWDTNGRMFWGDLLKASYQDRPSRLVNMPTPY